MLSGSGVLRSEPPTSSAATPAAAPLIDGWQQVSAVSVPHSGTYSVENSVTSSEAMPERMSASVRRR